ncbi:PREDICTED: cartilage matrix protein-like [Poecilia mexicana]|uniref:cartilage matrix protein-like n=1 Tax=Poecilia mexicana TaxID=48701 RepID=UPI00072E4C05|nr:PREDICTED: cartilage matrix protein-like [Poecilia mexicana]
MRLFISELVQNVHIGPNSFQIGLTKFSDEAKTEWNLNTHRTKESLLTAIKKIRQNGGETNTGKALDHVLRHDFSLAVGRRADSKKTVILITDGQSADYVEIPAKNLKDSGIEIYVVAVGQDVDYNELRIIASGGDGTYMYTTSDFKSLHNIRKKLILSLCHSAPSTSTHLPKGAPCETAKADIVMLVDGSSSVSPGGFQHMKSFISELLQTMHIGPNSFQIGLTQFSTEPKTEWNLNTYRTKESLLKDINNIKQLHGGTMTGKALEHILNHSFKPTAGMRPDSKKVAILITDGESQDDVQLPAKNLKDTGIEIYIIGVGQAVDYTEMGIIASGGAGTYVYTTSDFGSLHSIRNNLSHSLCHRAPSTGRHHLHTLSNRWIFEARHGL